MSLTRATCEDELVARMSDLLSLIGLSVLTDGTNPDVGKAIGYGYRQLGYTPASGLIPSDAELALLTSPETDNLLDIGEWRLLSVCRNRITTVRSQVGAGSVYWSELRDGTDRRLVALGNELKAAIGFGLAPLTGGVITLDIAETDATETTVIDYPGVA